MTYRLVPLKQDEAQRFVERVHRHLSAPLGDVIRVGLACDDALVGVAIAGRPVARMLDDGATLEVVRVAVLDGHAHACSRLYGAICRAAAALGYWRVLTYTRADEPGTSPRAAGFELAANVLGREWSCATRPRNPAEQPVDKTRWLRVLGVAPAPLAWPAEDTPQPTLFGRPA